MCFRATFKRESDVILWHIASLRLLRDVKQRSRLPLSLARGWSYKQIGQTSRKHLAQTIMLEGKLVLVSFSSLF